jgi:hypothetical protein
VERERDLRNATPGDHDAGEALMCVAKPLESLALRLEQPIKDDGDHVGELGVARK